MLLDIRETVRNSKPLKYTLIGIICVPFALVGIGSYFAGGGYETVATVNGEPIDERALEFAYQQQRQQLAQLFGGQIPEGFDNADALREQALEQLVTQQAVVDEVEQLRFAVGDETLGRSIRQRPEFQTDGVFDAERYRQLLGASGGQITAIETQFRDEAALEQFRNGVIATSFTLPSEAERVDALARQTRTLDAVRLDLDVVKEGVAVEDDAVQARFDENADSYRFPERAKIAWIELSAESLAESFDITDEEAMAWYEDNRASYVTPELREASHILIEVDDAGDAGEVAAAREEIEGLISRIDAGEAFEDLAREFSDDTGSALSGGSLGAISPGLMVEAFEDATYAIEGEGALSGPVETEFGVHLIRVDKIVPEEGQSFEDVRDEAIAGARRDLADRDYFDLREQLAELSFDEPDSLQPAADATGLTLEQSDWLDSDTDSGPILSHPSIRSAMFSEDVLDEGNNSDLIEVGERHVVVLRVTEHEDERPKTLDDVREEVIEALKIERAGELLDERAAALQEQLDAGQAVAELAGDDESSTLFDGELLTRQSTIFDGATLQALYAAPAPTDEQSSVGITELSDGDRLAWRIVEVATPEAVETDAESGETTLAIPQPNASLAGADPRRGNAEFGALIGALRERADVEVNL